VTFLIARDGSVARESVAFSHFLNFVDHHVFHRIYAVCNVSCWSC